MIVCQYNIEKLGDIDVMQQCHNAVVQALDGIDDIIISVPEGFTIAEYTNDIEVLTQWRDMIDDLINNLKNDKNNDKIYW